MLVYQRVLLVVLFWVTSKVAPVWLESCGGGLWLGPSAAGFLGFELGEATLEQRRKRLQQLSRWEVPSGSKGYTRHFWDSEKQVENTHTHKLVG